MKLTRKAFLLAKNLRKAWGLVSEEAELTGRREIIRHMEDQLGNAWMERIFTTRGKMKPKRVDEIIDQASSRRSGRLGPLYELMYYTEQDPRIGGLIDKRIGAVTRVLWDVRPGNKDNSQSVEAAEFLNRYFEDIRFKDFLKAGMDGRKYGVTAFQNIVREEGRFYTFEDPTNENQISQSRWFQEYSNDSRWGQLYIKNKKNDKIFIDNPNDIHPVRLTLFAEKRKRGYYDMTGFMGRVLRLYVAKLWTLTFFMQSIEHFGKPFIWATLPDVNFKDPKFKAEMQAVLQQFSSRRWGVFPQELEINNLDATSGSGNAMHFDWLDYINTELAITIVGQNLSTEVSGGSFAAAITHAGVEERIVEEDIEWIEEQINDEFIFWLVRLNYPDMPKEDFPILSLTPKKNIDIEKESRGLKSASELIDVPVEEVRARLQIRAPRMKDNIDEEATGADRYDEEVIGPSTNRANNADRLLRALGGGNGG